jgi:hypothetical protein
MKGLGVLIAHRSGMPREGWIGSIALAALAVAAIAILFGEGLNAWIALVAFRFAKFAIHAVTTVANRKS